MVPGRLLVVVVNAVVAMASPAVVTASLRRGEGRKDGHAGVERKV